ncbi:MAG: GTP-binding protein [Promethearchaeota archaeon]|nr:MAG: GTP-binding protein [Candidatus Lokiarchaeota archaeon]
MAEEYDYLFKSIVVGDGGVGKTALTLRFSKGFFTEDYKMTIGVDFHVKTINIDSMEGPIRAKLQIWDTGGQERFSSIRPMYYRGSLGALLIFDLTNSASFEHLPQWIEEVRANVKTEIPLLLVGNKSDLVDQRAVSLEEINNFTHNFNLFYMETSAKTGEGVGDCFYILACLMIGSGVPDQLISKGIVFSPGQVPITATSISPTPMERLEPEFDFAAPPVPEPVTQETSPKFEPEPEYEFEAPAVPEPVFEPEFEPEMPLPDSPTIKSLSQPIEFEFKTPDEILSKEISEEQQITSAEPTLFTSKEDTYKPKAVPFTSNVPVPAPPPKEFQSTQMTSSTGGLSTSTAPFIAPQDTKQPKSESLMDYLPEPIYTKKDKKKLEKQKKKEEKEKKLQEEKEKQEKLLEQMKKTKKEKKEKPKKEKKEKAEKIEGKPTPSKEAPDVITTPSLFQTLSQKTDDTEKIAVSSFMPFIAKKESETQEASKLRIIPNVSDIQSKPDSFTPAQSTQPFQPEIQKTSSKEIIVCKQCGAILSNDYQFCNKCGTQL